MKFKIHKVSDDYERDVEINSLEDLQNLEERFIQTSKGYFYSDAFAPPYDIIIDFEEREILVYDYYIE